MKITKEIEFNLNVEEFVKHHYITKDSTDEEIKDCIYEELTSYDDEIFYNFSKEDVFNEYGTQIKEFAKQYEPDLLQIFDDILQRSSFSTNTCRGQKAVELIRQKLSK